MVLFEELRRQIPSVQKEHCYGGKYMDRFHDIPAAGPISFCSPVKMKHCLEHLMRPESPEITKRINQWTNTPLEEKRIFHGILRDPQLDDARKMVHGIVSKDRTQIKDLIRPREATSLEEHITELKERDYASSKRRPLGRVPDPDLPSHIDIYKTTFGIKNVPDGGAGPLLNPPRRPAELLLEEAQDREHYLVSHKHLIAGEQGHRRYENFDRDRYFGMKTYADPSGRLVRQVMNWFTNDVGTKQTPVMSERQFNFKERYDHKLGKVRDPIKDTMKVPDDHTFGLPSKDKDVTVGQLIHDTLPRRIATLPPENKTGSQIKSTDLCVDFEQRMRNLMATVHHALKETQFGHGPDITAVLCLKANGSDVISMYDARQIYNHFAVPLDEELTEQVFDLVCLPASDEMIQKVKEQLEKPTSNDPTNLLPKITIQEQNFLDWAVDWRRLALLLDWNRLGHLTDHQRREKCGCAYKPGVKPDRSEDIEAVRRRLRRAIQANVNTWTTTNQTYDGDKNGQINRDAWIRLGGSNVKSNLPIPKIRSTSDRNNYGEDAGIGSLLNPTIFTDHGLEQRELLILRDRKEILDLFSAANLCHLFDSPLSFDQVWDLALQYDHEFLNEKASTNGSQTSLYAFKKALYKLRQDVIRQEVDREYAERCC